MKQVQFSKDNRLWNTIGEWSDEEAPEKWGKLQEWIRREQPYGFFRMVHKLMPGEIILGKLGPENMFIFAEDSTVAARIDDDGTVRIARTFVEKHFTTPPEWMAEALNSGDGTYKP